MEDDKPATTGDLAKSPVWKGRRPGSYETADTLEPHEPDAMAKGSLTPAPADRAPAAPDLRGLLTISDEHFAMGAEIARGGMGRIVRARDLRLGRPVAIKELLSASPELERRFEREMRITARLQHPAIISVYEAGRWPSGVAFFAMKDVEGRALDAMIDSASNFAERLALLSRVIDVAEALSYAHDRHVIHRDLKPGNVLIGDYGETVVIDWGLAKDLSHAGDSDDGAAKGDVLEDHGAADLTMLGEAMGTPAYMPPEQAQGEMVDERADVYAMGAMLYHLLAGTMPFAGARSAREILDRVLAGPPTPLGDIEPEVPADLLTIVERCMARDPEDRYPSATQLAEDLRRFQTGQRVSAHDYSAAALLRRWLVKHRTAVSVAGAMMLVLVAVVAHSFSRVSDERDRASEERDRAEDNQGKVEDLMTFMLSDLGKKLEPVGKLELLDLVASKADEYYAERPIDWARPTEVQSRAISLVAVADVLRAQGNLDEALAKYREAQAIRQRLVEMNPTNAGWLRDLSISHEEVGDVLFIQGALEEALTSHRASLEISERLAALAPADPNRQYDLAVSQVMVGDVLHEQGHLDEALRVFRASAAIGEGLAEEDPANTSWAQIVRGVYTRISDVLQARGELDAALQISRASLRISEALVKRDPDNTHWQRDLALGHVNLGNVLRAQGNLDEALSRYRLSKSMREHLIGTDPTNEGWQRELSVSYDMVGNILLSQAKAQEALTFFRDALAIRERLAKLHSGNSRWQRDLAVSYSKVGDVLREQGAFGEAVEKYRAMRSISERLAEAEPTNMNRQSDLSVANNRVGDALRSQGKLDDAQVAHEASLLIMERLVDTESANPIWLRGLSISLEKIGDVLQEQGDQEAALQRYQAALSISERLALSEPANPGWQQDLSGSQHKVATTLSKLGRAREARQQFATCATWNSDLATFKDHALVVAGCKARVGDPEGAFTWLDKAFDLGWRGAASLKQNSDLASLRSDPRYRVLLRRLAR